MNKKSPPDAPPIEKLKIIFENTEVQDAFKAAIQDVVSPVPAPPPVPGGWLENEWKQKSSDYMCEFFNDWLHFLPTPGHGLDYMFRFMTFAYKNPKGFQFINELEVDGERIIFDWLKLFVVARGKFMDSPQSAATINEWKQDPRIGIKDFVEPEGGYKTFNEFFTRDIKPGARPIADAQDDTTIVSPADGQLVWLSSKLTDKTEIPIKGIVHLNVAKLLKGSAHTSHFVGGTALACVLFPESYHHFHAPVSGTVLECKMIEGTKVGLEDAPEWLANELRDSDMEFSIFEDFHRGYFVIDAQQLGLVGMVAVGLSTISGITFEYSSVEVLPKFSACSSKAPVAVDKGDELGNFKYGGSLIILLFQKGRYSGITVNQGARIGKLRELPSNG